MRMLSSKKIILLTLIIITIFPLMGCEKKSDQQSEILSVMKAYYRVARTYRDQYSEGFFKNPNACDGYMESVSQIDCYKCPADFQEAFSNFIQAEIQVMLIIKENSGWGGFLKLSLKSGITAGLSGLETYDDLEQKVSIKKNAYTMLKKVALRYNVKL